MRQLRRRNLFSILRNFVRKFDAKSSNILRKIIIDYAIYAKLIIYKSTADILDFTGVSSICKVNFAEGITYPSAMRYFRLTYQPAMQSFKPYIPTCYANNPVKISIFRYADLSVLYYFNNQSKNVSTTSLRN